MTGTWKSNLVAEMLLAISILKTKIQVISSLCYTGMPEGMCRRAQLYRLPNRRAPSFIEGSLAGIYSTAGSEELNDGTLVSNEVRYIVNADNTGIVEIQNIDRDTGQTLGWFNSSFGICAQVIAGEMVWYRTRNLDGRFQGSRQPSASHCNSLTFADVSFARTHTLFEARENGDIAVIVANGENDCGFLPSQGTDCDANIINITSYFPTIFSFTPYDGQAPITVPDTGSIVNGETKSFDVLSNDIPGDSAIDLGSVEILVQPIEGCRDNRLIDRRDHCFVRHDRVHGDRFLSSV